MYKFPLTAFAVLGASLTAQGAFAATLLGSIATETLYYPDTKTVLGSATATVVNPGIEFPVGAINGDSNFQTDVLPNQIELDASVDVKYNNASFDGFVINFSGAPTITNVTLDPMSTFSPTGYSFTGNSVTINLAGQTVFNADSLVFDVGLASSVPEASTWAMMLLGFVGLSFSGYRFSRKSSIANI